MLYYTSPGAAFNLLFASGIRHSAFLMWNRAMAVTVAAVLFASCAGEVPPAGGTAARPNILLVTIDTWRADRLRPDLTPHLSAVAAGGVSFAAARSAVPLTLPSHATILTGLLPPAHGVRENGGVLAGAHPTVARLLHDAGYQTGAFVGAFVLDRRFGLADGFDVYDDRIARDPNATERLDAERPAQAVVDAALSWLNARGEPAPATAGQPDAAPFFLWVHVYDPHAPYVDHGSSREADPTRRYDGEIAYVDAQLGRLFDRLRSPHLIDRTAIILAGDHGEGLGEHGEQTHGMLVYDATLRVPLAIAGPRIVPARREDPVSLADIAPTILGLAGAGKRAGMTGSNLLREAAARAAGDGYAETNYPRVAGWSTLRALTDGRWKTIRAGRAVELYDLRADPGETKNLDASQSPTAAAMLRRLDELDTKPPAGAAPPISAEANERLRALGYVASSASAPVGANLPGPATHIEDWNRFEAALAALSGDPQNAVPMLKTLAARHANAPVFQTSYGRALKDSGRAREALAVYRAAAQRWPTDATLLHDLAVAAREAGARDEAAKADEAAAALDPHNALARNGLGLLAVDQGRNGDALRYFTEAARLDPNNATYWTNAGNAARAAGDRGAAEQAYRKALDVDPQSADAANGIGVLLVEAGRPAEAVQWLVRATAASSALVEARLNLGIALEQSGERQRAADAYRAVLAAPGSHPREKAAARTLLAALGAAR